MDYIFLRRIDPKRNITLFILGSHLNWLDFAALLSVFLEVIIDNKLRNLFDCKGILIFSQFFKTINIFQYSSDWINFSDW